MDIEAMHLATAARRSIDEIDQQMNGFLEGTVDEKTLRDSFWVYLLCVRSWHRQYGPEQVATMMNSMKGILS